MEKKGQYFICGYIGLIFFAMFLYGLSAQMIGTLISRIISHYDIHMARAGLLSSFQNAGNFVSVLIIAVFTGRINKMIFLGGSLFFLSASLLLISSAPMFGVLLASFSLMGVFYATVDTLINSLVADLRPDTIRGSMSVLHGLYGFGGLCCPVVVERLAEKLSWYRAYFIVSMVFVIYLVIYAVFVKWQWSKLVTRVTHTQQARFNLSDMVQFFKLKRNFLLWAVMFLYGGSQGIMSVWIKRYVETYLAEPVWGAYALSLFWIGIALSRLVVSPYIKAPSLRKIFAGNLLAAVILAIGLASGSVYGIAAASLVIGLCSGFTIPLILAQSCEWYQEKTAFGTLMPFTALFIALVVFPPLSGFISDNLGISWGVALGALCAILAAVFAGVLDRRLRV